VALPGFDFTAPEHLPVRSWLYDAASVKNVVGTTAERVLEGVRVWPVNCGPTGTWPSDPCAVIPEGTTKGGDRPGPSDLFEPITIWAWDECGAGEDENLVTRRALHLLDLNEAPLVESAFAVTLVANAGAAVSTGVDPRHAMTLVAQSMRCDGVRGVIHADMPKVSHAQAQNVINDSGALTLRPFGNPIATGCYEALGDLVIGTGPLFIWRNEPTVQFVFDYTRNIKMALAERSVLVAYEPCFIEARTATGGDSSAGGGGGPSGITYPAP
jgi:hypothetical protein